MRPRPSRPCGIQGEAPPWDASKRGPGAKRRPQARRGALRGGAALWGVGRGKVPRPGCCSGPRAQSRTQASAFPGQTQASPREEVAQLPETWAPQEGAGPRRALYANGEAKPSLRN